MAIEQSDLKFYFTTKSGAAGSSTASNGAGSLGKYISNTEWDGSLHSLFSKNDWLSNANERVDYRCVAVANLHETLTWEEVKAYLSAVVAGGANIKIGIDPTGVTDIDETDPQGVEIADVLTAPAGVVFDAPTALADALPIGDIGPDQCCFIWVERIATASGPVDNDGATIEVIGGTAA